MMSRIALRKIVITGDQSVPQVLEVMANIIGLWPMIVFCLKETGKKDDADSFVVKYETFFYSFLLLIWSSHWFALL